jgi:DNA transformation protein
MSVNADFAAFLQEQLEPFGPVTIRSMFGGAGLFCDGVMFGLIAYDTLYFKTGDANRADYEDAGMGPFTYEGKSKPVAMSYHQVPADLLEDPDGLSEWARRAFDVALNSKKAKKPKSSRSRKRSKTT